MKLPACTHTHGRTLCFACFRVGAERTRARREAYAQRALPFGSLARPAQRTLTHQEISHRQQMLAYLEAATRRRA